MPGMIGDHDRSARDPPRQQCDCVGAHVMCMQNGWTRLTKEADQSYDSAGEVSAMAPRDQCDRHAVVGKHHQRAKMQTLPLCKEHNAAVKPAPVGISVPAEQCRLGTA